MRGSGRHLRSRSTKEKIVEEEIFALVEEAQNHDEIAIEKLFTLFKPKVTAIAREYFLLGADIDDLVQEGMIGLYRAICVFDRNKNKSFSAFASLFIHRKMQNAVKLASRKKNEPLNTYVPINHFDDKGDDDDNLNFVIVDDNSNVEEYFLDREMKTIVISKVKDILTSEQYKLLKMFLNGHSYSDMANRTGMSTKQVDNSIQAIKRKLKSIKGEL